MTNRPAGNSTARQAQEVRAIRAETDTFCREMRHELSWLLQLLRANQQAGANQGASSDAGPRAPGAGPAAGDNPPRRTEIHAEAANPADSRDRLSELKSRLANTVRRMEDLAWLPESGEERP